MFLPFILTSSHPGTTANGIAAVDKSFKPVPNLWKERKFMDTQVSNARQPELPEGLRMAQAAIETPEVQYMMQQLAKFNLGVCMPHMHTNEVQFAELPHDMVQEENDLTVSFEAESEEYPKGTIPVAWRWQDGKVKTSARCKYCE